MKFKSNAKYGEEPKTGSIFALNYNSLKIVIHKYVGYGDTLFLKENFVEVDESWKAHFMRRFQEVK